MTEDSAAFGMVLHDDHAVARDNRQIVYRSKQAVTAFTQEQSNILEDGGPVFTKK